MGKVQSKIGDSASASPLAPSVGGHETGQQLDAFVAYVQCDGHISKAAQRLGMSPKTMQSWSVKWNWPTKLAEIDRQAREELAPQIHRQRRQRLELQLRLGVLMLQKSYEYFEAFGCQSDAGAIRAAHAGAELISRVDLIPELLLQIALTDDMEQLRALRDQLRCEFGLTSSDNGPAATTITPS